MASSAFNNRIAKEVEEIKIAGLFKEERIIASEQGAEIMVNGKTVLNFCANNYLGLFDSLLHFSKAKRYPSKLRNPKKQYPKSSIENCC